MHYPEMAIVAALPLADYYLTIWGAKLADAEYGKHFKSESYELNPMWRADVAKGRLVNPRHLAIAALLVGCVALVDASGMAGAWAFPAVFGLVLGAFAPVLAQHAANILMFDFIRRHPAEIEGVITVSMRYTILLSLAYSLVMIAPLAIAAWFTRAPVVLGMLAGASVLALARLSWLRRATRESRSRQ